MMRLGGLFCEPWAKSQFPHPFLCRQPRVNLPLDRVTLFKAWRNLVVLRLPRLPMLIWPWDNNPATKIRQGRGRPLRSKDILCVQKGIKLAARYFVANRDEHLQPGSLAQNHLKILAPDLD